MTDNSANASSVTESNKFIYASNKLRTILVMISFYLFTFFSVVLVVSGLVLKSDVMNFLEMQTDEMKLALINTANIFDAINALTSIFFIVSGIIFLFWIYRANSNARALHPEIILEFTPGWCVGNFFIPVLSLYWPYKAVKELWILSMAKSGNVSCIIVYTWWITFLMMNFLSMTAIRTPADNIESIGIVASVTTVASIFGIISALTAIRIVRKINKAEAR